MILSFHPIYTADQNIICAGRLPGPREYAAIRGALAVILPQGCTRPLYEMARENCRHVFPNLDIRFAYPGKLDQIKLFEKYSIPFPPSVSFASLEQFHVWDPVIPFPWVIKLNWGGEGTTIFKIDDPKSLDAVLARLAAHERTGQLGFIVQQWIPSQQRSLRVVLIGRHLKSYWRVQPRAECFGTAVSAGALIDFEMDQHLQIAGRSATARIADQTGLQLAGLDFIFDERQYPHGDPLLLEINHYFGRSGLGGSRGYYRILIQEIDAWLSRRGLQRGTTGRPKRGTRGTI